MSDAPLRSPVHSAEPSRRDVLANIARGIGLAGIGGALLAVARNGSAEPMVWQIDPEKCTQCGRCATECVLTPSAAKAFHAHALCGYCKLCTGFFDPQPLSLHEGAENQLCPTGAIIRTWVEDQYFEYTIDSDHCIGCARCVKGCSMFGNGSLFMQIDHGLCVDCNRCSIAARCPSQAIARVPLNTPYRLKIKTRSEAGQ